jgi:predicted nucleotidyltransferase
MTKKVPKEIARVLNELKKRLKSIYGDTLKDIILYGSYARGDSCDGSDIDIIILLTEMDEPRAERERYFDAVWELDLEYDTVISIMPLKEED